MEKRTPHCPLSVLKTLDEAGAVRATTNALRDARAPGLRFGDRVDVVKALARSDFYKRMTTHDDHRIWQAVYRPQTAFGHIYIKLAVSTMC